MKLPIYINFKKQSGFTILEVLVSFVIATLLLSVILSGFGSGMNNLLRTDRQAMAALIAQSRLAEIGVITPLQVGSYQGSDKYMPEFSWQIEVKPLEWGYRDRLANVGSTMFLVNVTVSWSTSSKVVQVIDLTTLRISTEADK